MNAISIQSPRSIRLIELTQPAVGPEDVLLRVLVIGLCGTDLNTYRGQNPLVSYPRVPGHEIGAVIEQCGSEVPEQWKPGMIVTCSPYTHCGACSACGKGRFNACKFNQTLGVQRDGALTEFVAISWRKLFYAAGLKPSACALVEPLAVGYHAVARGDMQPGDTVVVIGAGMVGLGAISGAAQMQASRVIAVDVSEQKLDLARKAGATDGINSTSTDLHQSLLELTDGRGADLVIEAVGKVDTFLAAVSEACYGGRIVYVGYANRPVTYETKEFLLKELSIQGSRGSSPEDFQNVIAVLQSEVFPISETITHTISLDQVSSTMQDWDSRPGEFTKIQVQVSDSPNPKP